MRRLECALVVQHLRPSRKCASWPDRYRHYHMRSRTSYSPASSVGSDQAQVQEGLEEATSGHRDDCYQHGCVRLSSE